MTIGKKLLLPGIKFSLSAIILLTHFPAQAERTMNVTLGPDSVFEREVSEIIPELTGASMTNENGRVGGELVFWGHTLANGSEAYLFACSIQEDVDCQSRMREICPAGSGKLLISVTEPGLMLQRECKSIAFVGAGELRPGCYDDVFNNDMLVGLMQCPAN